MDVTYFQVMKINKFEIYGIMVLWTPIDITKEVFRNIIYSGCVGFQIDFSFNEEWYGP